MSIHDGDGDESDDGEKKLMIPYMHSGDIQVFMYLSAQQQQCFEDFKRNEIYTVACSPVDSSLVATGGKDDKGFLWKIGSAEAVLELQGHRDTVSTVAFSSDGQLLASGSFDGVVHIWDTTSGSLKCTLEGSGEGFEVRFDSYLSLSCKVNF
ncbi:F-box-like/WD repeat-containing protein TBL1Y [Ananas comosus]|uniref:F-box-like/WD repeat-containing protein TBL1Y n=1 Tax=Ananas comosus TaxID=4615 RepID=A0A199W9W4_ANACO|nr:F-box-like/WD repeat-containing protein TBL1Y [Ananas comosus]